MWAPHYFTLLLVTAAATAGFAQQNNTSNRNTTTTSCGPFRLTSSKGQVVSQLGILLTTKDNNDLPLVNFQISDSGTLVDASGISFGGNMPVVLCTGAPFLACNSDINSERLEGSSPAAQGPFHIDANGQLTYNNSKTFYHCSTEIISFDFPERVGDLPAVIVWGGANDSAPDVMGQCEEITFKATACAEGLDGGGGGGGAAAGDAVGAGSVPTLLIATAAAVAAAAVAAW